MNETETHPLPPFLPPNARLLMLGSFPPPQNRWKMNFYYPNFQNDMWRVFGLVFFGNKDYFVDTSTKTFREQAIRDFLTEKGIAIYDTAYQIQRLQGNAADKFLKVIQPIDLEKILTKIPACHHLLTTGDLATQTLLSLLPEPTIAPKINQSSHAVFAGRKLYWHRLPSTSRAYPLALAQKAQAYADLLTTLFQAA